MPTSLLLAIATTIGVAAGVFLNPSLTATANWFAAVLLLLAFLSAAREMFAWARVIFVAAFIPFGAIIAAHAQETAAHPPLRQFLEERIGGYAIDSEDVSRHDT